MLAASSRVRAPRDPVEVASIRAGDEILLATEGGPRPQVSEGIGYRVAPESMVHLLTAARRELLLTPDHPVYGRFLPGGTRFDVALVKEVGRGAVLVSGQRGLRETSEARYFYRGAAGGDPGSEEIFLLGSFPSEKRALLARKLWNLRFGVPESTGGYRDMSREEWRELFREVDTLWRAQDLLEDLGMDPRSPHWVQRSLTPAQLRKQLLLDARWTGAAWRVEIRRPSRSPGALVRLDPRAEVEHLHDLKSYQRLDHVDIDRRYELGGNRAYRRLRAAAVLPGMALPVWSHGKLGEDPVVQVERVEGQGLVYRLEGPPTMGVLVEEVVLGRSE